MTSAADTAETRQWRSSAPKPANINPVRTKIRSPCTPSAPIWPIDSAPITQRPPTMTSAPMKREAEIRDAGAQHQRQERDARPDVAMREQIDRREADLQAMSRAGKAQRPEQRRGQPADNANQCRRRIVRSS